MKKVIVILTIVLLISSLPLIKISAETHKKSYDELKAELLERMERKDDTPFDFAALRLAYTETPDYNPYVRGESYSLMREAFDEERYEETISYAKKVLDKDFVNIEAHLISSEAYKKLNNERLSAFHKFMFLRLLESILSSGKHRYADSPEAAWVVISVDEEYQVLWILGLKSKGNSLIRQGDHYYDKHTIEDEKTGVKEMYFNIDIPYRWLDRKFITK